MLKNSSVIGGFHFCGTILAITRTGRYPATCPAEPGLSSAKCLRTMPRPLGQRFQVV
jgi:hypothetical protein